MSDAINRNDVALWREYLDNNDRFDSLVHEDWSRANEGFSLTGLHLLAMSGDLDRLDRYAGVLVDPVSSRGITPLMLSCSWGHFPFAERLLERGADPSLKDRDNRCALSFCCSSSKKDVPVSLLKRLVAGKSPSSDAETDAMRAFVAEKFDLCEMLVAKGERLLPMSLEKSVIPNDEIFKSIVGKMGTRMGIMDAFVREGLLEGLSSEDFVSGMLSVLRSSGAAPFSVWLSLSGETSTGRLLPLFSRVTSEWKDSDGKSDFDEAISSIISVCDEEVFCHVSHHGASLGPHAVSSLEKRKLSGKSSDRQKVFQHTL